MADDTGMRKPGGRKLAVPRGTSLRERLLARVRINEDTGCWEWTLDRNNGGYGRISLGARGEGRGFVHRVAWELWNGPIPEGMELDHLCRVRHCCNPVHLEVVTPRVNAQRRGVAVRTKTTHCARGHEFSPENTKWTSEGRRRCRECWLSFYRRKAQNVATNG